MMEQGSSLRHAFEESASGMLSPATKKLTKIAQKLPLLTWAEQTTSVQEHLDMSPTQGPGREEFSENAKIFVDYHLLDLRTVCEGGFVCWSAYGDFRLHYGTFGGPFMFAGNNFTLTGAMELAGPCPTFYAYGQSIQGCDDGQATFIGAGGGTFVLKGAGQRSIFINEGELFFSQPPCRH
jgi:hypothetical protein